MDIIVRLLSMCSRHSHETRLAGEQALEEGLPLVAGAVLQVLQGSYRLVCEAVYVLSKAALYDACTHSCPLSASPLPLPWWPHCCC